MAGFRRIWALPGEDFDGLAGERMSGLAGMDRAKAAHLDGGLTGVVVDQTVEALVGADGGGIDDRTGPGRRRGDGRDQGCFTPGSARAGG